MAENNRLNLVAEVATIYGRIMQAEAGFTPVNVQTAVEMSAAQIKEVTAAVEAIIGGKGKVEVSTSVKKDIGGGLVVSIGDRYTEMKHIDLSTSAKVQKYSALLKQGM